MRSCWCLVALAAAVVACGETTDIVGTRSSTTPVETPPDQDVLDDVGVTEEEAEMAIRSAYEQLFFGDPDTQAIYRAVGDDAGYIEDVNYNDVRTDAIGYGMFVTVQVDDREVFDKLWTWTKRYMLMTAPPRKGLLRWSCSTEGTDCASSAATDATSFIVTSLYLAQAKWGDAGAHDYEADANTLVDAMVLTEERNGGIVDAVQNMFDIGARLPRKTSSTNDEPYLFTDYVMPAFYDYWSKWRTEDAQFWLEAAEASRNLLRTASVAGNGLIPLEIESDGSPAPTVDYYDERSARTLLNRWFCHAWTGPHPWVYALNERLLDFLSEQDLLVSSYYLTGKVRGDRNTVAHLALTATAAAATEDTAAYASFLQALADQPIPEGDRRYYDGMLYLISFMAVSGNIDAGTP
ncbi:MAG TPA: glycosyl hydrolase family 8 [Polyangiaceae bacterium]